ncbi:MAG TPA: PIN domain-containing protein [Candidatus Nitrosotenuis sp.]|jgi:predicted nucleic acid-binding protein|nr:PIN domain-containing protein [Candidatus Nitrosotenuis sp.]
MSGRIFVDSNVLVYSRASGEPGKQPRAMDWRAYCWRSRRGCLSFQVLQEYYVTVTRKLKPGVHPDLARADVRRLLSWRPLTVDVPTMEKAWRIEDRYGLSWWDSLVVATAQAGECRYLLTEDLQEGQEFDGLRVVNPFTTAPPSL